jgi:hypothetical protein
MDVWMYAWMDGWIDVCMDVWIGWIGWMQVIPVESKCRTLASQRPWFQGTYSFLFRCFIEYLITCRVLGLTRNSEMEKK